MTPDEMQTMGARLFAQIDEMMSGFPDELVTVVLLNLTAKGILDRCAGKSGEDVADELQRVCSDTEEAILGNLRDDPRIPTIQTLLDRARTQ